MKGRSVTAEQKRFHDLLIRNIGCIACKSHGVFNDHASVHHIDGRTKPDAHWLVLGLCGPHHQDDGSGAIAVHPWKARFEAEYGKQRALLAEAVQELLHMGVSLPDECLRAARVMVPA